MSLRLIDLMCERHRALILDARTWPADNPPGGICALRFPCPDCGSGEPDLLPGLSLRRETVVHEAGHAVAYLAQGATVRHAQVALHDPHGYVEFAMPMEWKQGHRHVTAVLAGQAASRHWLDGMGMLDDAALVEVVYSSQADTASLGEAGIQADSIATALVAADALVTEHWPAIERVADALLARGRLDGAEIAALAGVGCVSS